MSQTEIGHKVMYVKTTQKKKKTGKCLLEIGASAENEEKKEQDMVD